MMLRRLSLSIAIAGAMTAVAPAAAQSTQLPMSPDERAVRDADDAFWRAFNACDAAGMTSILADDVEFYHDMTGLTRSREAVAASLMKGPCGTPGLHMRRELVAPSPLYQAVPGYGAMLAGEHIFYARQGDAPEKAATNARFLVIWKRRSGGWLMTRIVSYDHRSVPYRPPATSISIPPDVLKRYVGRYRTEASGDVDITAENDRLVLRSGSLRVTLAASAPNRFFALERDLGVVFPGGDASAIEIEENGGVVAKGTRRP
jgi:ketosteroid isomerase-like protein